MVGTERGEKLSCPFHSPSKCHLWPGCPRSGDLGAELGMLGAGPEQICAGPPEGSVLCREQAPSWRPLCLRHAGAIPKHAPARPGKRCQPAGSVLPTDFACSSYFPLLSLAPAEGPAPGFVCLNPPCAELLLLCGVPGFGQSSVRTAPVAPSHQLDDVFPARSEAPIPQAASHRVHFFPSLQSEMPLVDPSLLPLGTSALSSGLSPVTSTGPLRTRGFLAGVIAGQAEIGAGLPLGSASPCSLGTCSCSTHFPESRSTEGASGSLSVISFGSQPDPGWAVAGQPPLPPFDLLPLILDASF